LKPLISAAYQNARLCWSLIRIPNEILAPIGAPVVCIAAHVVSIVQRDLKPGNILMAKAGVKL